MSYCRFSEADVYVYAHVDGGVECCGCAISLAITEAVGACRRFFDARALVEHLRAHLAAGHEVPERLLDANHYDVDDFARSRR